ncbi:MAG: GNAT family N-acetyltransferase [Oscillospiraceae bacterium]|jgi:ribosomal protein S18 acetylase RimI-like enzyme|nr:GNAT family N-acetyltransferase [Oscillospiraceae bacterium]
MPPTLHFVDAVKEEHFRAMSLIHALGWRDTYKGYVPQEYLDKEITDDRWVSVFRNNFETKICSGLLLYRDEIPVACINYCPARLHNYNSDGDDDWVFLNASYAGWGEIASFYTHPEERGKGYGGLLIEEALKRLRVQGFENVFVFVLRENERARKFYSAHGFSWDGTHADIPFPPDKVCVDLRYTRKL